MIEGTMLENIKGWGVLLSGIWGFILLPFAGVLIYSKKFKTIGIVLVIFVGLFVCMFLHDINAHIRGQRPWVPFYEWCFGSAIPIEGRSGVFANCPFTREIATLKVTHVQRGNHAISVWIPEKMKDFTPVKADIKFNGQFRNRDGKPIFDFHSDDKFAKLWTWCRGKRGGSHEIYYKYSVPRDVPLDEELTLEIRPVGEVDDFVQMYPAAELAVEKYSDK